MRRRDFIAVLGSAAAWPMAARAQQPALPVVASVFGASREAVCGPLESPCFLYSSTPQSVALRKGLSETGVVVGRNVTWEDHFLEFQYDRLPAVMADLVRRRVAMILVHDAPTAIAAKKATATIPIVFELGIDPVELGLVASHSRPGGNATGVHWFPQQLIGKRLELLHNLVPKAVRVAVLINPSNVIAAETQLRNVQEAAPSLGLQIQILNAATIGEIDAAFATIAREHLDALFVAGNGFFVSRTVQFVTLAARDRIPATYASREAVAAGGLMSYATDAAGGFRQVGVYTGQILKGAKPADLPVVQSSRFEFVINLGTARALGIDVRPQLVAIADEVIE